MGSNFEPEGSAHDDDLSLYESNTHLFIVKIWLEESAEEANNAIWRGHITYVPTGKRKPLQTLGQIDEFITPWLEQMGVRIGCSWRVKKFFLGLKLKLKGQKRPKDLGMF